MQRECAGARESGWVVGCSIVGLRVAIRDSKSSTGGESTTENTEDTELGPLCVLCVLCGKPEFPLTLHYSLAMRSTIASMIRVASLPSPMW
jgi:hypothetical protein